MTRLVRAEAEPIGPASLARLREATEATREALRATIGSRAGADIPEAVEALREALRASQVPSPSTVAKRAIEALKSGLLSLDDLDVTFAIPAISLVGYDLKVEGVGLFKLDVALGAGISLAEITLAINPLPPPTIVATLRLARGFDAVREDVADTL